MRKGVYPYDYVEDWKKFNEKLLPEKEDFYSHLNMVEILPMQTTHIQKNKFVEILK